MKWALWGLGLALTFGVPVGVTAQSTDAKRAMVLLYAYESSGPEAWSELSPQTVALLASVYRHPSHPTYVRLRAVGATGYFRNDASREFLRTVANAKGQRPIFVRHALFALSRAFGDAAFDDIHPHLASRNVDVREAAVTALARMPSPRAQRVLDNHLASEKSAAVIRAAHKARND